MTPEQTRTNDTFPWDASPLSPLNQSWVLWADRTSSTLEHWLNSDESSWDDETAVIPLQVFDSIPEDFFDDPFFDEFPVRGLV